MNTFSISQDNDLFYFDLDSNLKTLEIIKLNSTSPENSILYNFDNPILKLLITRSSCLYIFDGQSIFIYEIIRNNLKFKFQTKILQSYEITETLDFEFIDYQLFQIYIQNHETNIIDLYKIDFKKQELIHLLRKQLNSFNQEFFLSVELGFSVIQQSFVINTQNKNEHFIYLNKYFAVYDCVMIFVLIYNSIKIHLDFYKNLGIFHKNDKLLNFENKMITILSFRIEENKISIQIVSESIQNENKFELELDYLTFVEINSSQISLKEYYFPLFLQNSKGRLFIYYLDIENKVRKSNLEINSLNYFNKCDFTTHENNTYFIFKIKDQLKTLKKIQNKIFNFSNLTNNIEIREVDKKKEEKIILTSNTIFSYINFQMKSEKKLTKILKININQINSQFLPHFLQFPFLNFKCSEFKYFFLLQSNILPYFYFLKISIENNTVMIASEIIPRIPKLKVSSNIFSKILPVFHPNKAFLFDFLILFFFKNVFCIFNKRDLQIKSILKVDSDILYFIGLKEGSLALIITFDGNFMLEADKLDNFNISKINLEKIKIHIYLKSETSNDICHFFIDNSDQLFILNLNKLNIKEIVPKFEQVYINGFGKNWFIFKQNSNLNRQNCNTNKRTTKFYNFSSYFK